MLLRRVLIAYALAKFMIIIFYVIFRFIPWRSLIIKDAINSLMQT